MPNKPKGNSKIGIFVVSGWIFNGPKIQADSMKILKIMAESIFINNNTEEADQEKSNGEEMIGGIVDHLLMKKEVLLPIAIMKTLSFTNPNAKEMHSKSLLI